MAATRALSPWAQDQRRIRRLRKKVREQYDRAEGWMKASDHGWKTAHKIFDELRPHLAPDQVEHWEQYFEENEPF
jgi:hypothetical protein